MFGMHDTYNICLYIGVFVMLDTLVLWDITFPKHTGGALHVHLALLLGTGDGSGDSIGLDVTVESGGVGDLGECWLTCGFIEVSRNTLLDV